MNLEGVFAVHVDGIAPVELYPGVRKRTLLKSESPTGTRVLVVEIYPGHRLLQLDVHERARAVGIQGAPFIRLSGQGSCPWYLRGVPL